MARAALGALTIGGGGGADVARAAMGRVVTGAGGGICGVTTVALVVVLAGAPAPARLGIDKRMCDRSRDGVCTSLSQLLAVHSAISHSSHRSVARCTSHISQ